MLSLNNQYGTFTIEFPAGGNNGLLNINPEMAAANIGIKPTGRYFIYCVHPERGSCSFILARNENNVWFSERHPAFIDPELITWIGGQIEQHVK
ncbi:MAG: hypothetical protein ABIN89_31805 [Chitinophagaceae bacterium]